MVRFGMAWRSLPLLGSLLALGVLAGAARAAAPATEAPGPQVRVDLISESAGIQPGGTFWVGVRQRIAPGWHTYWVNPGDSGEPMTIDWQLPRGILAGPIAWPHPGRIPVGPAMSFGYTDDVVVSPGPSLRPRGSPPAAPHAAGAASWLVCEKICIPESAPVSLVLPVGPAAPDPAGAATLARARQAVPVPSPWPASFQATPETITLTVAAPRLARERLDDVWFYPARWGAIEHAAPQQVDVGADGMTIPRPRAARWPRRWRSPSTACW